MLRVSNGSIKCLLGRLLQLYRKTILNKVMLEGSIGRIIPQIPNKVMLQGNISTIVPQYYYYKLNLHKRIEGMAEWPQFIPISIKWMLTITRIYAIIHINISCTKPSKTTY